MERLAVAALTASLVFFVIFFANVGFGAARYGVFLGDVAEMLTLFAAAVLFAIGVLAREALEAEADEQTE